MESKLAIKNLEAYKEQCLRTRMWSRNVGLSAVFDQMIKTADEQIALYKIGQGRLQISK